ncbi:MAG: M15 family metallopeptidase [Lachnospiraceae bacterium]|nr:M15 family metallopeptidase [Lachnospiraceae bacterium]
MSKKHNSKTNMIKKFLKYIVIFYVLWIAGKLLIEGGTQFINYIEKSVQAEKRHVVQDYEEWNLILVNTWNEIPEDYDVTLTELSNGQEVDSRIYPYLQDLFDAMREDGIYPIVREGYRTADEQQRILDDKVMAFIREGYSKSRAKRLAEKWVAIPGTSEHQLGIAVDINADKEKSSNEEVYEWLAENAYKYGFILRYPQGKEDITGTAYEPWHYRYVGEEAAEEIFNRQICLEEYFEW